MIKPKIIIIMTHNYSSYITQTNEFISELNVISVMCKNKKEVFGFGL